MPHDLVRANTVFTIHHQPNGHQPFIERDRRILKYALSLDAELLMAILCHAFPYSPAGQVGNPLALAMWAYDSI
jgi:hypothetical protein